MVQSIRAINYKLTDKAIQAAKPKDKPFPMTDGGGLFLEVLTSGSKVWRYAYMVGGKRGKATIGAYPTITVKAARDAHEVLRKSLATGTDPARQRRIEKLKAASVIAQAQTFEPIFLSCPPAKSCKWLFQKGFRLV